MASRASFGRRAAPADWTVAASAKPQAPPRPVLAAPSVDESTIVMGTLLLAAAGFLLGWLAANEFGFAEERRYLPIYMIDSRIKPWAPFWVGPIFTALLGALIGYRSIRRRGRFGKFRLLGAMIVLRVSAFVFIMVATVFADMPMAYSVPWFRYPVAIVSAALGGLAHVQLRLMFEPIFNLLIVAILAFAIRAAMSGLRAFLPDDR